MLSKFILLIGLIDAFAWTDTQSTKLSLDMQDVSFYKIIEELEGKSDYVFIYVNGVIDPDKKYSVNARENTIDEILDKVLKNSGIKYEKVDKQIILIPDKEKPEKKIQDPAPPDEVQPQNDISGTVIDENGEPIPGVTVLIKGTTRGTTTDPNGDYTLTSLPENAILVFSFIGMKTQEVETAGKIVIHVTLLEDKVAIEEVIAVGYGVQKKQSIVGSIAKVESEELTRTGNVTDFKQALTGQIAGLTTIVSSGEPGGTRGGESATNIFIRGQSTWNGGQPLVLIDGVERDMQNIEVSVVESISVLKDASATAVFGVKGANGVILITTKRGSMGKAKFSVSYTTTAQLLSKLPEKMDSYNAIMIRNEAIEREVSMNETSWNDYIPYDIVQRYQLPQTSEYAAIYPNVDWQEAMFKDVGFSHKATINSQGGSKFVSYFASLSYLHEADMFRDYENNKGYEPNYNFDRFNFRSNLDFHVTRTTKISLNLSGYYAKKNMNWSNDGAPDEGYMWGAITFMAPDLYLPQYDDGRWGYSSLIERQNPVAVLHNMGIRENYFTDLNSDIRLEQDLSFITKGLSAKATVAFDSRIGSEGGIYDKTNSTVNRPTSNTPLKIIIPDRYEGPDQDPDEYIENVPTSGSGQFDWAVTPWYVREEYFGATNGISYIPVTRRSMYELQLNYVRGFGLHNVSATGVFKREQYAQGSMFPVYREDWVFRATYDYDLRYLLEVNGAYNGSEQFGPGYRFDFFPSLALGWYVSNEEFFKVDWIYRLKLRYSIGMVGDDNVSGDRWLYASQYSYGGQTTLGAFATESSPYIWYQESVVGNPEIRWEKALKSNYGLELGLFKNTLSFNFDYYTEDRTDVLISGNDRIIPPYFGATAPSANLGQVKSNGYEIESMFRKRLLKGLDIWASIAFSHNENEIIEAEDPQLLDDHLKSEGYAIGQTRTVSASGFCDNWDDVYASVSQETSGDNDKLPGSYNLIDFNADGVIKSEDDRIPIGYSNVPQNTFNFSFGISFKGWSFMTQIYAVNNITQYYPLTNFYEFTNIVYGHVEDYWSEDNLNATSFLPRWKTSSDIGDYYCYDGSYVRLKTVELSYVLSENWVKRAGMSSLRIFLNGNNLFFWSDIPSDREATSSGGSAVQGSYPTLKRINLGVEINF